MHILDKFKKKRRLKKFKRNFNIFSHRVSGSGFTLIELLVVIAIIGILTALLMFNYLEVTKRARDNQRKSDLQQIRSALELYRSDNGVYPGPQSPTYQLVSSGSCTSGQTFASGGTVYMQKVPCDPSWSWNNNTSEYFYYPVASSGSDYLQYTLAACIENQSDRDPDVETLSAYESNTTYFPSGFPNGYSIDSNCANVYVLTNP